MSYIESVQLAVANSRELFCSFSHNKSNCFVFLCPQQSGPLPGNWLAWPKFQVCNSTCLADYAPI